MLILVEKFHSKIYLNSIHAEIKRKIEQKQNFIEATRQSQLYRFLKIQISWKYLHK